VSLPAAGGSNAGGVSPRERPGISADGSYVVFYASSEDLVPDDANDYSDVFLRDRVAGTTELLSVSSDGTQGNEHSADFDEQPTVSADGRYVVFVSEADNLVANDDNDERDVFIRDRLAGTTRRASLTSGGVEADAQSNWSVVTDDGSEVLFSSQAYNLGQEFYFPPTFPPDEIYAHDIDGGSLALASRNALGDPANDECGDDPPAVSPDGRHVAFDSYATNLIAGVPEFLSNVYAVDRATGDISLVSVDVDGELFDADADAPAISADGRFVAFEANSGEIYLRDRGDFLGPSIANLVVTPNPASISDTVEITATADDTATGNNTIASAEYRVDQLAWRPMVGADGVLNNPMEDIRGEIGPATLLALSHQVCVRATDAQGNTGPQKCAGLEVEPEESVARNLQVSCMHSPIWPQPGDTVTITVDAYQSGETMLGELLNDQPDEVADFDLHHNAADVEAIEIWVDDYNAAAFSDTGVNTFEREVGTFDEEGSFVYGCRAVVDGKAVFSGWRRVSVGDPVATEAIAVLMHRPVTDALDIVIMPDQDDYTGPSDPAFLEDVEITVRRGLFEYGLFLAYQDRINIWIARDFGDAQRTLGVCDHALSLNWHLGYAFADAGLILHTECMRDCALGGSRVFSSEPADSTCDDGPPPRNTVRHELGHRPFGLADEYCCDGGYSQADIFPNVYEEPEDCQDDAPNLGVDPGQCREFTEDVDWWFDSDWSLSDSAVDDLMSQKGRRNPQPADLRRMRWLFTRCERGKC
jgi:Tol biopolymer transport system component